MAGSKIDPIDPVVPPKGAPSIQNVTNSGDAIPIEKLENLLASDKEPDRKRGVLLLSKQNTKESLVRLLKIAELDPQTEVRFAARKALNVVKTGLKLNFSANPEALAELKGNIDFAHCPLEKKVAVIQCVVNENMRGKMPFLVAQLSSESDPQVLSALLVAIGKFGNESEIGALIPFLQNPSPRVRANAIEALELIGSAKAYPHIFSCLQDSDNRVRANAIKASKHLDPAHILKLLKEMVESNQDSMKASAAFVLQFFPGQKSLEMVISLLKAADPTVRANAIKALHRFKERGIAGAAELLQKLEAKGSQDVGVPGMESEGGVSFGSTEMGTGSHLPDEQQPRKEFSIEELVSKLKSTDKEIRNQALGVLGLVGEKADSAIPVLSSLLNGLPIEEKLQIVQTMRKIRPSALVSETDETLKKEIRQALFPKLSAQSPSERQEAIDCLELIPPAWEKGAVGAKELLEIQAVLKNGSVEQKKWALGILKKLGTQARDCTSTLFDILLEWRNDLREPTLELIKAVEPNVKSIDAAKIFILSLLGRMAKWDFQTQCGVIRFVGDFGVFNKAIGERLRSLATEADDPQLREMAAQALSRLDPTTFKEYRRGVRVKSLLRVAISFGALSAVILGSLFLLYGPIGNMQVGKLLFRCGLIGRDSFVAKLTGRTVDKSVESRLEAVNLLGSLGNDSSAAVPTLLERLFDDDDQIRRASFQALPLVDPNWRGNQSFETALTKGIGMVTSRTPSTMKIGEEVLNRLDPSWQTSPKGRDAVPALIIGLTDDSVEISGRVETLLGRIASDWPSLEVSRNAIPELGKLAAESSVKTRGAAVRVLSKLVIHASEAVRPLLRGLTDGEESIRQATWKALETASVPWPEPDRDALVSVLESAKTADIPALIVFLKKVGPGWLSSETGKKLLEKTLGDLRNPDQKVRRRAFETVKGLGKDGKPYLAAYIEALNNSPPQLRSEVIEGLDQIDPNWDSSPQGKTLVAGLRWQLVSRDPAVLALAIELIGKMKKAESLFLSDLISGLKTNLDEHHARITALLNRLRPSWADSREFSAAVPKLVTAFKSGPPDERRPVISTLEIGMNRAEAAKEILLQALSDPDPRVREIAARMVGKWKVALKEAIPALRKIKGDEDFQVRTEVIKALKILIPGWDPANDTGEN